MLAVLRLHPNLRCAVAQSCGRCGGKHDSSTGSFIFSAGGRGVGTLMPSHGTLRTTKRMRTDQDSGLPAMCMSRVLTYINAHLDQSISLSDLAHEAHLSVYYFATQFKRSTGFSPQRFILQYRVNRARELLRTTSLSVLDVSLDLGFRHQNNFTRAFRRITGTTPSRFRQEVEREYPEGGRRKFERRRPQCTNQVARLENALIPARS